MPFQVNDSAVLISLSKYQRKKTNEVTFEARLLSYFCLEKKPNQTFKNSDSKESVKTFIFPINFEEATFAVSRMSVTMLSLAILSFKVTSH